MYTFFISTLQKCSCRCCNMVFMGYKYTGKTTKRRCRFWYCSWSAKATAPILGQTAGPLLSE